MKKSEEFYIINNDNAQSEYVGERRAEKWLSFLLPHLKKGDTILDCGCGAGSLTMDIAEYVYPGKVTGVDMDSFQINQAKMEAERRGIKNVVFIKEDILNLPFEKESFDVIYAHTLLIHLKDQLEVLKKFYLLLKPGGIVGIADDDWSTAVDSPELPLAGKTLELMAKVILFNGGNPFYSRHLRTLLYNAGFEKNEGSALANESYGNSKELKMVSSVANTILKSPDFVNCVLKNKFATQDHIDDLISHNEMISTMPNAFHAHMYCTGIGWKPE